MIASPPDIKVRNSVSLASLTSFRVGGKAEWFISPTSVLELAESLAWRNDQKLPLTLIGAGSNLLIGDNGIPGLVICTRHLRGIDFDDASGQVTVAAGEPIARLAWQAAAKGWSGLEWAVGIPGTVGGGVAMNAGAQGGCVSDYLVKAQIISMSGDSCTMLPDQMGFNYRTSMFQDFQKDAESQNLSRRMVTGATFQLHPGFDPEKLTASTAEYLKYRQTTQPYNLPSCGSVFRNPHPQSAAWLIEHTGLKGYQIGNAQVANLHANFILNRGGAKASDIFSLIQHIQETVQRQWSILLEPEVKMLGCF
jgi:UDP-N-acetylmuramate dehydrogenase